MGRWFWHVECQVHQGHPTWNLKRAFSKGLQSMEGTCWGSKLTFRSAMGRSGAIGLQPWKASFAGPGFQKKLLHLEPWAVCGSQPTSAEMFPECAEHVISHTSVCTCMRYISASYANSCIRNQRLTESTSISHNICHVAHLQSLTLNPMSLQTLTKPSPKSDAQPKILKPGGSCMSGESSSSLHYMCIYIYT